MTRLRVGLATYHRQPALTDDDRPLIAAFDAAGVSSSPVRWDDRSFHWSRLDGVVIRSCWDYHLRVSEFERWLEELASASVPVFNAISLVRWNMNKRYLRGLSESGVRIPATVWLDAGDARSLDAVFRDTGWAAAIVKPTVSASATDTWLARESESGALDGRFREQVSRVEVMVQEYLAEVTTHGEWSLVFIDGTYSHAAIKRPRSGDFRVQNEHGGSSTGAEPNRELIRAAAAVVEVLPAGCMYARIDGVETTDGFVLMEAECIEPDLFFRVRPDSRSRLASAITRQLKAV
jgi:glutathione synthase/RimK-type ligase-like ATP-grasp enzyme